MIWLKCPSGTFFQPFSFVETVDSLLLLGRVPLGFVFSWLAGILGIVFYYKNVSFGKLQKNDQTLMPVQHVDQPNPLTANGCQRNHFIRC